VVGTDVELSPIGQIIAQEWQKTEQIRANVKMDEWVIMPNHLHGIVVIEARPGAPFQPPDIGRDVPAERLHLPSERPSLKANSLGAIIGQIKSVCTKQILAAGFHDFAWQPRFYDHIIRDETALQNIRRYIVNNPAKWALDEDNPANFRRTRR
jgi:REP element-mobilizing transposase RayT